MKKILIFCLGFLTALVFSAGYKIFFKEEIKLLNNPFSTYKKSSSEPSTTTTETAATSSTEISTSTIH